MKLFTNITEISGGTGAGVIQVTTAAQALLAANEGVKYLAVPLGALDDAGVRGMEVIEELVDIFSQSELDCKIIATDVHSPIHVTRAARFGCYGAVVGEEMREKMANGS
jgi:transaldolase